MRAKRPLRGTRRILHDERMAKRAPARLVAGLAALALLAVAGCTSNGVASSNRVLVVDKAFDLRTADPHRELDTTGAIVARSLYSTLLTFDGVDEATPIPFVASAYTSSADATTFTFKLRRDIVFSDGTSLTSADVVFSYNRVINLKARPSSLLAGVNASAPDATTVVLQSKIPNPALPFIVANPALAIVNSNVVKARGGTDRPGADRTDKAEPFLNGASAGSGPYVLKSFSTFSDVELTGNPRYWGPKPYYPRVVIRNMDARTQLAYMSTAKDEVALDLTPAQAGTLSANRSLVLEPVTTSDLLFLFVNEDPHVSSVTPDKHFQNAVRYALDYGELVRLMGAGSVQAPGVIPSAMLGALPAWAAPHRDIEKARVELAAVGIKSPTVSLGFANDLVVSGLPISTLASMVAAELGEAGIKVTLAGSPTARAMADYAAGTEQMGLWPMPASSADTNEYLAFLPGRSLGLRARWPGGADPSLESLGILASTTAEMTIRTQLFQLMQGQLNDEGPFFPLLQPGRVIVAAKGVAAIDVNPTWSVDLAAVRGT